MKIFVSGGSGFIRNAVVSTLSRRGHDVTALVNDNSDANDMKKAGARKSIIGNLIQGGEWCDAVRNVDKIISLDRPVEIGENLSSDEIARRGSVHTESVTNLIKAATDGSAKGIVLTYDGQCYGDRRGKWVEGDPGALEPMGYCRPLEGRIGAIEETAEASGMPVVSVYPSLVYGNGGWFKSLVDDIKSGKAQMVEPGDNHLNIIHVDDLATLYAYIVEKVDTSDTFILSDNMPLTQKTFIGRLSELLDVDVPKMADFRKFEKKYGRMYAEMMSINTKLPATKTFTLLEFGPKLRSYEFGLPAALKSIGIEPMAREETMRGKKAA